MPPRRAAARALLTLCLALPAGAQEDKVPDCGSACASGELCMNFADKDGKPACRPAPAAAPLTGLILPFDSQTEAVCVHGSGSGSHSSPNAFYALDLATPYDQAAATVRAAADGKAFVFLGEDGKPCPKPKGTAKRSKSSHCGEGWGNHVKVLHAGGYATFYVHLEKVLVQDGQTVSQGDPLGIEGATGLAGQRHLHWSVQKASGSNQAEWEARIARTGESVPFSFQAVLNGASAQVDAAALVCAHARIGEADASLQPRLKGVKP